jgi:hypothetical protein
LKFGETYAEFHAKTAGAYLKDEKKQDNKEKKIIDKRMIKI